ncbi:MAG: LCP family protein [Clostridia bacterium]|nr:LCP family protein [Clostridia bacterium]
MRRLVAGILPILLLAVGFCPITHLNSQKATSLSLEAPATAASAKTAEGVYLLVGVDKASYSADVMMLVRVESDRLSFLQIPRDSLTADGRRLNTHFAAACVKAKNEGKSDREAYAVGGKVLAERLGEAFGVTVKAHATLTLSALSTLIDAIGGVTLTLPCALDYVDPEQGLTIHLKAGEQHLDGAAAEGLVRCRNAYPDADYGRMRAQRLLIGAVFDKLRQNFSPLSLLSLFRRAYGEVETDLSFGDALPLLKQLSGKGAMALRFATVCGSTMRVGKAAVEVLAEETLHDAVAYLGGTWTPTACQKLFFYHSQESQTLYFSKTPPPFIISE